MVHWVLAISEFCRDRNDALIGIIGEGNKHVQRARSILREQGNLGEQ